MVCPHLSTPPNKTATFYCHRELQRPPTTFSVIVKSDMKMLVVVFAIFLGGPWMDLCRVYQEREVTFSSRNILKCLFHHTLSFVLTISQLYIILWEFPSSEGKPAIILKSRVHIYMSETSSHNVRRPNCWDHNNPSLLVSVHSTIRWYRENCLVKIMSSLQISNVNFSVCKFYYAIP